MSTDTPTNPTEQTMNTFADDSAYPKQTTNITGTQSYGGLSKRERFAAMAMQGLCANNTFGNSRVTPAEAASVGTTPDEWQYETHWPLLVAILSVRQADSLIAALNQSQERQP